MTQVQVDRHYVDTSREYGIRFDNDEDISLKVRKRAKGIYVTVYKGQKGISFSLDTWVSLMKHAEVVDVATQLLEGTAGQV